MDAPLVAQLVGAALILVAFMGAQFKVMTTASARYLWLNLAGAGILTVVAWIGQQWGFFILEAVWTGVSAWAIARR